MRDIGGLQVKVLHLRRRKPLKLVDETRIYHGYYTVGELKSTGLPLSETLASKGGETIVQLYKGETLIAEGRAVTHPNDFYCKAVGRHAALGRALKKVGGRIPGEKINPDNNPHAIYLDGDTSALIAQTETETLNG